MAEEKVNARTEITPSKMKTSFVKHEKEFLMIPQYSLDPCKQMMTVAPNVRYKETMSQMKASMQLAPWDPYRRSANNVKIQTRELETFLGNNTQPFDPTSDVYQSVWGDIRVQKGMENTPFTVAVWTCLMASIGEGFFNVLFSAKRNDTGSETKDLFNGFGTIADEEIAAGNISTDKKNLFEFDKITQENAVDVCESIFDAMDPKLKKQKTFMLMSPDNKLRYERDYRASFGTVSYNNEFKKTFIEGSENKCQIVSLDNVPDDFIQVTPKWNPVIGLATSGEKATFEVKPSLDSQFLLDFVASMFFGCQYRSIDKEFLLVAKQKASSTGK